MDAILGLLFILVVGVLVTIMLSRLGIDVPWAPSQSVSSGHSASPAQRSPRRHTDRAVKSYYRTQDGQADYQFSFEPLPDGAWRAYIVDQPGYQGRSDDAHATHRLSASGRKYVCWTDPLRSLEQARRVAALWADATQKYIRYGTRF